MAFHVHRSTGMQIKQTDTVTISLQFRIIDKLLCDFKLTNYPITIRNSRDEDFMGNNFKYLAFNTYTLVASRKKRALHTRSHQ